SFSAENPNDPETLAGRWLAHGAFVYFGSSHEPYLSAFRTPGLVADLLAEGLPFGASARMNAEEAPPFGNAWRLVYLGDPLYRPLPRDRPRRIDNWAPVADWPAYDLPRQPSE